MGNKKTEIEIIVSGNSVKLEVNQNQPLKGLIEKALKAADETGDPGQWGFYVEVEGKYVDLDENLTVEEVLSQGKTVYLNKKAGAAGDR